MRTKAEIEAAFSPRESLDGAARFFLLGVGGAGMSAVARMLRSRGHAVAGVDATDSALLKVLDAEGVETWVGTAQDELREGDAVVVTDAVDLGASPEVARARGLGLPLVRRSQALGWLLQGRRTVAVTGTHGKSTTTAMLGSALREAGLDPLVVVGAEVPQFGGAVLEGQGEWAVVEACEAYDSFHDLDPYLVVLTNLELDHVDFHGSWEGLLGSVRRFLGRSQAVVFDPSDSGSAEAAAGCGTTVAFRAEDWGAQGLASPGWHNRANAAAALAAARLVGADEAAARRGIAGFRGVHRRLQVVSDGDPVVVDDYAHHPTEVAASVQALREAYPGRRLVVAFQPHLYSRTEGLVAEFAHALSAADLVVLTDIYPAREAPIPGVGSYRIVDLVTAPCRYVPSRHLLPREVARLVRPGDVVVGMGAGNIEEFAPALVAELARPARTRVAVAFGGDSSEREVSILGGRAVRSALEAAGYDAFGIDVSEALLSGRSLGPLVGPGRPDVVFLVVHGRRAEDGAIQGLLELLHLPYTGSGIVASALALDKSAAKRAFSEAGLCVPRGALVPPGERFDPATVPSDHGWVVKPNDEGSTVGLSFVESSGGLPAALERAWACDSPAVVEEWLKGTEISVPVLGGEALPPVEIVPASGAYDYASKYVPGATEEVCPARLPDEVLDEARRVAVAAHRSLGCRGVTRTDMIVDRGRVVVLETNTLPGMTETSLVPRSAREAGIDMPELCRRIVEEALGR